MIKGYYEKKIYEVGGARKRAVLTLIHANEKGKTLLDVGCAGGEFGEILKRERGLTVHGVDVSPEAISFAKKVLDHAEVCDIESSEWHTIGLLPEYDYILASEVLEHLFSPERLLGVLKKYASDETRIIITVPNILFWKNRLNIFFGRFAYTETGLMDRGHIHFFSWKTFKQTLYDAGYAIERVANNVPTRGTRPLGKLFPGLFAYQFIVSARIKQ